MTQSLEEIADRIIVCGVEELEDQLRSNPVSLIVSTCTEEECKMSLKTSRDKESAQTLIDKASTQGIKQHQSFLYQMYGDFLDRFTPEPMSEEEEQAYFFEQAHETLDSIEKALSGQKDKKVIIHCMYGSDRSAMVAIAYFIKHQGEHANIEEALQTLQKIRPSALLEDISKQFRSHFGEKFDAYQQAIIDYREALIARDKIPQGTLAQKFFMSGDPSGTTWNKYTDTCQRFGINPNRSL